MSDAFENAFDEALRLRHAKKWQESAELFERLLDDTRGDKRLRFLVLAELGGLYLFDLRNFQLGAEVLGRALELGPKSHACSIWRFYTLVLSDQIDEALEELRRYLALASESQLTSEHSRILREIAVLVAESLSGAAECREVAGEGAAVRHWFVDDFDAALAASRVGDFRRAADRLEGLIESALGDRRMSLLLLLKLGQLYLYELNDDLHSKDYLCFLRHMVALCRAEMEREPLSESSSIAFVYALVCSGKELEAVDELKRYLAAADAPMFRNAIREVADVMVLGVDVER
jgi:tetratricopeptide (TPR) repeat protein